MNVRNLQNEYIYTFKLTMLIIFLGHHVEVVTLLDTLVLISLTSLGGGIRGYPLMTFI